MQGEPVQQHCLVTRRPCCFQQRDMYTETARAGAQRSSAAPLCLEPPQQALRRAVTALPPRVGCCVGRLRQGEAGAMLPF